LSKILRAAVWVVLAATLGGGPAFAETIQCRFIQSRKERNACYERQSAAKAAASESSSPKMIDPIDRMKLEDDRLTKRLQGICRGC
jgi:hypothetical protein